MSDSRPANDPMGSGQGVLATTNRPVAIDVKAIEDDRTPDGMVCQGTFIDGRLVARCVVVPEVMAFVNDQRVLADPVRLALAAREDEPGLKCQLYALIPVPESGPDEDDDEGEAPWADSVPGTAYEQAVADTDEQDETSAGGEDQRLAAILLGEIVRFSSDRRHPESLTLEAIDVLTTIISGDVAEVVDKVLEDLLKDPPDTA